MNSPEKRVVEKVEAYFKQICAITGEPRQCFLFEPPPAFQIQRERVVPIGRYRCRTDVALLRPDGETVALVECKSERWHARGKAVDGREQLKSYLCATDTAMGIFANSQDIEDWEFYRNLGRNAFLEVSRSDFEEFVLFAADAEKRRWARLSQRISARLSEENAFAEAEVNRHKAEIDRDTQRRIAEYQRQQQQKLLETEAAASEKTGCVIAIAILLSLLIAAMLAGG